jgi:hypothetical protein
LLDQRRDNRFGRSANSAGPGAYLIAAVWIVAETINIAWPRHLNSEWYLNWGIILTSVILGPIGLAICTPGLPRGRPPRTAVDQPPPGRSCRDSGPFRKSAPHFAAANLRLRGLAPGSASGLAWFGRARGHPESSDVDVPGAHLRSCVLAMLDFRSRIGARTYAMNH